MEVPGTQGIHPGIALEAERLVRNEGAAGYTAGWNLRVANRIYGMRAQYPYEGRTITKAEANAVASWMGRTVRQAEVLQRSHQSGVPFPGNIAYHPGIGADILLYVEIRVDFTDGRTGITLPAALAFSHVPSRQEVEAAADMQTQRYVVTSGGGGYGIVSSITYTRLWRGT